MKILNMPGLLKNRNRNYNPLFMYLLFLINHHKFSDLVKMGFKYDNIIMEEAAQILEIETFIPLLLQTPQDGHNRLKRWIMIGDHHQLPPVIKNMAFQKFSNMEQSLFTRLVRLGTIHLFF